MSDEWPPDVFLSYSRQDTEIMRRIRDDLRAAKFKVWTDERLEPGTKAWEEAIENAIENTRCLVIILSPDAKHSPWVGNEMAYADTRQVKIIPVLARGDEQQSVPVRLIRVQRIDVTENYATGIDKLITTIEKYIHTPIPGSILAVKQPPPIAPKDITPEIKITPSVATKNKEEENKSEYPIPIPPPPPPPSIPWLLILLTIAISGGILFVTQNRMNNPEPTARSTLTVAPTTTTTPRCTSTPTPDPDHATLVAQENLTAIAQTPPVYATLRAQETLTAVARIPSAHATFVAQETATAASLAITPC